jgi:phage gpG-like protein
MISIKIDKDDLAALKKRLADQMEWFKLKRTPLMQIATQLYKSVMKNFEKQGTDVKMWKELSPMTIAMRKKGKATGSPKILQNTGHLKMSIFPKVGEDFAQVGTTVPYAKLMQMGGSIRVPERDIYPVKAQALHFTYKGKEVFAKSVHQKARTAKIPPRPFLFLRQEHKDIIVNIARRWFFEGQKGV